MAAMSMDPSFVRSRGTSSAGSFRAAVGRAAAAAATGDYEDGDGYGAAEGGLTPHGRAVQADPIKSTLKPTGSKRLKVSCDILLSTSAFIFNLCRYSTGTGARRPTRPLPRWGPASWTVRRCWPRRGDTP